MTPPRPWPDPTLSWRRAPFDALCTCRILTTPFSLASAIEGPCGPTAGALPPPPQHAPLGTLPLLSTLPPAIVAQRAVRSRCPTRSFSLFPPAAWRSPPPRLPPAIRAPMRRQAATSPPLPRACFQLCPCTSALAPPPFDGASVPFYVRCLPPALVWLTRALLTHQPPPPTPPGALYPLATPTPTRPLTAGSAAQPTLMALPFPLLLFSSGFCNLQSVW